MSSFNLKIKLMLVTVLIHRIKTKTLLLNSGAELVIQSVDWKRFKSVGSCWIASRKLKLKEGFKSITKK